MFSRCSKIHFLFVDWLSKNGVFIIHCSLHLVSLSWSISSSSVTSNSLSWVPVISAMMSAVVRQRHRQHFHEIVFALGTTARKKQTGVINSQTFKSCIWRPVQHVNIRIIWNDKDSKLWEIFEFLHYFARKFELWNQKPSRDKKNWS